MKASEIASGQGATGRINGKPVAVYNTGGDYIVLENVCSHMGCQTEWNSSEQTWDCPCHGSRYRADGSVLRGPASKALNRLDARVEDDEIVI